MKTTTLWDYQRYPLRSCYSLHECQLCRESIMFGQKYYDGGYKRRVHKACAERDWERQQAEFIKNEEGLNS